MVVILSDHGHAAERPAGELLTAAIADHTCRFALLGLGTVVAAVAANTAFCVVGSAVVDCDQEFLPLANVSGAMIFTVFPATVAVLLYAGLLRFTRNPARILTIISAIVFVVTLIPAPPLRAQSAQPDTAGAPEAAIRPRPAPLRKRWGQALKRMPASIQSIRRTLRETTRHGHQRR